MKTECRKLLQKMLSEELVTSNSSHDPALLSNPVLHTILSNVKRELYKDERVHRVS